MNQRVDKSIRIITVVTLLYVFLVSIKMMGSSFKLFGSGFAEQLIESTSNPFVGLFIGILATGIIQSSSTTTSLVVALVGGSVIPIEFGIPIIMGANIGTSITCVLVSLGFVTRKEDFRRAFAGATVHDFFNLCTVVVFFPLEIKFHLVQRLAFVLTDLFEGAGGVKFTSPLKTIINPAVHMIQDLLTHVMGISNLISGVIMLVVALAAMISTLIFLVKTLRTLLIGSTEIFINKYLFRNDFVALILGMCITAAVQSSSITTSLIVPLVGAGIVTLERCYPYTLGANIGTTITAILASLATVSVTGDGGTAMTLGVTAAFAHLSFNIFGILVFYPLRRIPIFFANRLASLAAESKKWAFIFVFAVFFLLPFLAILLTR
ncbi:MAG TPA: Na/Pi symporter [Candidatus Krumholzibacterium sp.]|nr:Na/Pi symporter [Candidatus Krumholzibacterium sp.]